MREWGRGWCRCAERLLLGDENVSTSGGTDLEVANNIAREMVYRCGFSSKLGPVSLMDREEVFLGRERCPPPRRAHEPLLPWHV